MRSLHTRTMRVPHIVPLPRLLHGPAEVRLFKELFTNVLGSTIDGSLVFNQVSCAANPGFQPVASGGNGASVQFCKAPFGVCGALLTLGLCTGYVGYDPQLDTVIVAHQGTSPSEM